MSRLHGTLAGRAVILFLHENGPRTLGEIVTGASLTRKLARDALLQLESTGAVKRVTVKSGKERPKVYWRLVATRGQEPVLAAGPEEQESPVALKCSVKCPFCATVISFTLSSGECSRSAGGSGIIKKAITHGDRHVLAVHVTAGGRVVKVYGYECVATSTGTTGCQSDGIPAEHGLSPEQGVPDLEEAPAGGPVEEPGEASREASGDEPAELPGDPALRDLLAELKRFL
ncbi:MAG: hypothetical protein ACFFD4_22660 [Candidatus Odinarchaeota archaeon]